MTLKELNNEIELYYYNLLIKELEEKGLYPGIKLELYKYNFIEELKEKGIHKKLNN